jgi:hypothetical protein
MSKSQEIFYFNHWEARQGALRAAAKWFDAGGQTLHNTKP